MKKIISFDRIKSAKRVLKEGIPATRRDAKHMMYEVAWYLVNHTTYSPSKIREKMKKVTEDYFLGMPERYIDESIDRIIEEVKNAKRENMSDRQEKIIVPIYVDELNAISFLDHKDTERLAFAFLVYFKLVGHKQIQENNPILASLAWRYLYDEKNKKVLGEHHGERCRVSGSTMIKRIATLCSSGIVKFKAYTQNRYQGKPNTPPAVSMFTVPIAQKQGEVAFEIHEIDAESFILYYDRYCGYSGIVDCAGCGTPVLKTNNKRKYCARCAEKAKRSHIDCLANAAG